MKGEYTMTLFAIARVLHIVAGIIWGGTAVVFNLTVAPSIAATGDAGKQFVGYLMMQTRFRAIMMGCGLITVLAGSYLYGVDSSWFQSAWMRTNTGIGFGIGGFAGILGFVFGAKTGSINEAMAKLGGEMKGQPTPEQLKAMQALLKQNGLITKATTVCVLIAIVMMASARLLG
jgi:uncharacterized membrane protein